MDSTIKKINLFAGALTLGICGSCVQSSESNRPNILFIIADDMSFPHAGAYGCTWVNTPVFDRVAREGILFTNAYTSNAKSAPSRASILTGQYSWQLEEAANHIGFWPEGKFPTFVETLADNGYRVAFTGKGWAPGDPGKRRLTGTPYQEKRLTPPTKHISNIDYPANFKEFLNDVPGSTPWMFWFGSHEPHRAYEFGTGVSKGGKELSDVDKVPAFWPDNEVVRNDMLDYAFEVEYFDRQIGMMIKELEERGLFNNTLIVITSDNGMPFPRSKGLQYEYSNHMPLAIVWPDGITDPGRTFDEYINFVDIAPTFLKIAGVKKHDMQPSGKEMIDIFQNVPDKDRSYTLLGQERHDYGRPMNQGYPIRSIMEGGYLYIYNFKPDLWPAGNPETGYLNTDGSPTKTEILNLRREGKDMRYWNMSFGKNPQEELYWIAMDPECLINLAANPLFYNLRKEMNEKLFDNLREQKDPRVSGEGDIFDKYPFMDEKNHNFYERFMNGEIKDYQTGWVNRSDYEEGVIE